MNREQQEELASLYALGALDGDELAAWHTALASGDPETLAVQGAQQEAVIALACAGAPRVPAPATLRTEVLSAVAKTPQVAPPPPGASGAGPGPGFRVVLGSEGEWQPMPGVPGARCKRLAANPASGYVLLLIQLDPGTRFPEHPHAGHEEIYVLSGDAETEGRRLKAGDFFHADPGTQHAALYTEHGCRALLLAPLPPAAAQAAKAVAVES